MRELEVMEKVLESNFRTEGLLTSNTFSRDEPAEEHADNDNNLFVNV